ncbi:putative RNA helicase SDE3-like isoform X1 [Hibiscus syriacus]|uniref:RNA helicase SDE3-like isoform X1 n=1 Tax=Hibiscus syriacus TaxID=106335 RepID=A0A6A2XUU0_HIBSY|nr:putative RNA helicase SDE3-like isoform X1 [Hibiscus syriacus]
MEFSNSSSHHVPVLVLSTMMMLLSLPVYGQINNPCTPTVVSTFTPCMNFLTNTSSANVSSPSVNCCNSLKNLTSGGMDCVCLIVTGNVPFWIPINRTLAISLPLACNMAGVPLQCKAAGGAPIPAPGPISLAPTLSPGVSPSLSPTGSVVPEPTPSAEAPDSDTTPALTPPSSTDSSGAPPTATTGSRAGVSPSAAHPSYSFSPFLLVLTLGFRHGNEHLLIAPPCGGAATAIRASESRLRGRAGGCRDVFASAFKSGDGYCFCYVLRQPLIFGFPLNKERVASLPSFCMAQNGVSSLDSLCSSDYAIDVPSLPPLPSTTDSVTLKPSNSHNDSSDLADLPPEPAVRLPTPPSSSVDQAMFSSATNQVWKQRTWFLLG